MNPFCKIVRSKLKLATLSEFEAFIREAKLTPTQEDILKRHIIKSESICKISLNMHISERQVSAKLRNAYLNVHKAMQ